MLPIRVVTRTGKLIHVADEVHWDYPDRDYAAKPVLRAKTVCDRVAVDTIVTWDEGEALRDAPVSCKRCRRRISFEIEFRQLLLQGQR